jgi:hypothetical protein
LPDIADSPEAKYSSPISEGDYLPYFYIENSSGKLDLQLRATNYILLVFVSKNLSAEKMDAVLNVKTDHLTYYIAPETTFVPMEVQTLHFYFSIEISKSEFVLAVMSTSAP